jgi:hypothetical protein
MADPVKAAQVVEMALKRARQAAKSLTPMEAANQSGLNRGLSSDPYTRSLQLGFEHGNHVVSAFIS